MNYISITVLYNLFELYIYINSTIQKIPLLMYLICSFDYTKKKLHKFLYRVREEPNEKTWICSCYMSREPIQASQIPLRKFTDYNYREIYGKIDHSKYIQNRGNKEMICDYRHIPIFIFKYEDNYTCRLLFGKDNIEEHYTYDDDDSSMWVNIDTNDNDTNDNDTNDNDTNDNDTNDNMNNDDMNNDDTNDDMNNDDTNDDMNNDSDSDINDTNDTNDTNDDMNNDSDSDINDTNDDMNNDINDKNKGIDLISLINFIPSNVRFYSIEYTNPMMETSIQLQLPQNYYMVGTQLLSSVFIARLLEYTIGENNIFNMDYKLNIMDDNIQLFSLLSNQYIELYENEYKIKDL